MRKIVKIAAFFIIFGVILHFFGSGLNLKNAFAASKEDYEAMCTMEVSSGRVLYSKNANKRLPIASTTKILTAIVAIENAADLDKKHEIKKEATGIEGSSIYLKAGEHLSLRELLFGLMLRSGNDAAVAIAIIVSGTLENFMELMNSYCEKLGLENSHFVSPNGLHNDEHYSSALDLAKISAYALKNETFAEIVASKEKLIDSELDQKNKCRLLKNKNKLLKTFEGADGIKTGYTKKAGKCFVGSSTRNGMQVVCVVLNSRSMFDEASKLLDRAFDEFEMKTLFKKGELIDARLPIKKKQNFPIFLKNDINFALKRGNLQKIWAQVVFDNDLKTPISDDEPVGRIEIYNEKDLIFSDKIYTINIDDDETIFDFIGKVVRVF